MFLFIVASLVALAAQNSVSAPNPFSTGRREFQGEHTMGTISVQMLRDTPTELVIEFWSRVPLRNSPFENSRRTIRIDLRTGLGTYTRAAYTEPDGTVVPAAAIEICPDCDTSRLMEERRRIHAPQHTPCIYGLFDSALGQIHQVSVDTQMYYDITNLRILRHYSRHGIGIGFPEKLHLLVTGGPVHR